MRLDHIGIAVKDLEKAILHYENLLGIPCDKREIVESEHVETAFFPLSLDQRSRLQSALHEGSQDPMTALGMLAPKLELLGATSHDSPIQKFLDKRGEGIHHLAFEVEHLDEEIERLKADGFIFLSDEPKLGADQKRIIFLHPKEHYGVLIELCESL